MGLGIVSHVALGVSDRPRSEAFYDPVLRSLGYRPVARNTEFTTWWSPQAGAFSISVRGGAAASSSTARVGLHHLAFSADSPEQVDQLHALLVHMQVSIVSAPDAARAEALGYYAVVFADPDGTVLELVCMPLIVEHSDLLETEPE